MSRSKEWFFANTDGLGVLRQVLKGGIKIGNLGETHVESYVVLDIATERIALGQLPEPRLAVIYSSVSGGFRTFAPKDFAELRSELLSAQRVVSFNGDKFDIEIIRRHLRLRKRDKVVRESFDLFAKVSKQYRGLKYSLHELSALNLGERKLVNGADEPDMPTADLEACCRSDVSQTHSLYQLFIDGELRLPVHKFGKQPHDGVCPNCGAAGGIYFDESYGGQVDELTDGQLCHFMNGEFGNYACIYCGEILAAIVEE